MSIVHEFKNSYCLEKYNELFDDEKHKAHCFDELASLFFDKNFSATSKSDIELLMFHFLMERMISMHQTDGILDYIACSDYNLSKILGITETRVRNLKIKKELAYPVKYNWIHSFANILNNSKLTKSLGNKVLITIPDPNVLIEVRNFLEENGDVVEKHLNSKILEINIEHLFLFALMFEKEECAVDEVVIKDLRNKYAEYVAKDAFSDLCNASETVNKLCSLLNAGNKVKNYIVTLIRKDGN